MQQHLSSNCNLCHNIGNLHYVNVVCAIGYKKEKKKQTHFQIDGRSNSQTFTETLIITIIINLNTHLTQRKNENYTESLDYILVALTKIHIATFKLLVSINVTFEFCCCSCQRTIIISITRPIVSNKCTTRIVVIVIFAAMNPSHKTPQNATK